MPWIRIADSIVNIEEIRAVTINQSVQGKFEIVVLFKNGQTATVGSYATKDDALKVLENTMQQLKSASSISIEVV